jgi:hypothetical protein
MCHFITAVIDRKAGLDRLNQLGRDNGITFNVCDNDYIKAQLKPSEAYIVKNCRYCSCGTRLGLAKRAQSGDLRIEKREIEKLQRKGWSEHKIRRWVADREKNIEKAKNQFENLTQGKYSDIENWLMYINGTLSDGAFSHIGLILHWYEHGPENEKVMIKERKFIKIGDLTAQLLLNINEDVIYDITQ